MTTDNHFKPTDGDGRAPVTGPRINISRTVTASIHSNTYSPNLITQVLRAID